MIIIQSDNLPNDPAVMWFIAAVTEAAGVHLEGVSVSGQEDYRLVFYGDDQSVEVEVIKDADGNWWVKGDNEWVELPMRAVLQMVVKELRGVDQ